jgi:hydroxypyruvate reductase
MNLLRKTTAEDLVFCLLSGGGSALLTYPAEGLSLRDKRQMTRLLINCGAPIGQINAVRKHMSQVKGGRLAKLIHPASLISLILSDVVGDPIETVASGPTAPDSSTFFDCQNVFDRYGLTREIPRSVAMLIQRGCNGEIEETPKHGDPAFDSARNIIVGNNQLALLAATQEAENLGYRVLVLSESAEGEAADVAVRHVAVAKEILAKGDPIPRPACVLSGGEATVTVTGNGLGGRNQEFALAAAQEIDGLQGVVALSGGTDGTDGPTDAAGGIVDGATMQRAESKRLNARDYLKNNDSYHFLRATDDLLITGPTFTNVMDLRLVLVV